MSAVTDALDGYLARKWKQVSLLGKFLDPLADKILVMATLVWMVPMGRIDAWLVVVLLTRELSITGLRSVASSEGIVISARQMGKKKTAFQMVALCFLLLHYEYEISFIFLSAVLDTHAIGTAIVYLSLFFSMYSGGEYFASFVRHLVDEPTEG